MKNKIGAEPESSRADRKQTQRINRNPHPLSSPSGSKALAWHLAGDTYRIQTNTPETARAIAKLTGARRVAYSVAGSFLQQFDLLSNEKYICRIIEEIGGKFLPESRQSDVPVPEGPI